MRVILSTFGSRGDVYPMLALAVALQHEGCLVAVCAPPDFASDAAEAGLEFHGIGDPMSSQIDDAVGIFAKGRLAGSFRRRWREQVANHFEVLDDLACEADLVVETSMSITGPTVAESAHVPFRYVALVPTAFPSRYHAPGFLPAESLPLGLNLASSRLVNAAISQFLGDAVTAERIRRGLKVAGAMQAWQGVFRHGQPLLAADPVLAPLPPDLAGRVLQTSAMRIALDRHLSAEAQAFLDAGDPPVFVGFGSMPESQQRALWPAVAQALGNRRAIVQGLGAPKSDEVLPCGDEPHELLFPRCSAVVHHGGAGTTFAAAVAGVPQVVVPFLADQFYWGRRIAALGLGAGPIAKSRLHRELPGALETALRAECVADAKDVARRLTPDGAHLTARELRQVAEREA